MPVLSNSKHEHFAQAVAKGVSASKAYVSAGYSKKGAQPSSARMLSNAMVLQRIKELQEVVSAAVVACEIRKRSARVQILQANLDRMSRLIEERAIEYAEYPAGATGMLVKDYRGKNAEQMIWKFDAALVGKIAEVLKQAAIEEGQWTEKREISGEAAAAAIKANLKRGMLRVAAEKAAALARGEAWSE